MVPTGAIVFAFAAGVLAVVVVGGLVAGRPGRDQRRAAVRLRELNGPAAGDSRPDFGDRPGGIGDLVSRIGRWVLPRDGKQADTLGAKLAQAGYRHPSALLYFIGLQLVLVVGVATGAGAAAALAGFAWPKVLLLAAGGAAAGLLAPSVALSDRLHKRQRAIRNALPDALDILVLGVEGGASLNAAVAWVAEEIPPVHPVLGAEMLVVEREMQLGLSAGDAFGAFADRCGLPEARDLAGALQQSEKYGASAAKALRAYSDQARMDRQLWAEETAQKAAVKIIFPMLLCIFPAMFIVLLGPAAMQMSTMFAK